VAFNKDIKIQNKINIENDKRRTFSKNSILEKSPTSQEEGKANLKTFVVFHKMKLFSPFFLFV